MKELRMRIVVPPMPGIAKFDEVPLPTLNQSEPAAGDTVVRTLLPFRHEGSQTAVESLLVDNQRASLIRATASRRLVDFLFVDNGGQNDSISWARHCEPTGPARSGRPDDKLREAIQKI
jgi:hypothetical protein